MYSMLIHCLPSRVPTRHKMTYANAQVQRDLYASGEYHIQVGEPLIWKDEPAVLMRTALVEDTEPTEHRSPEPILGVLYGEARPYESRARTWFVDVDGRKLAVSSPYKWGYDVTPLRDARWRGYQSSPFMLRRPAA